MKVTELHTVKQDYETKYRTCDVGCSKVKGAERLRVQ